MIAPPLGDEKDLCHYVLSRLFLDLLLYIHPLPQDLYRPRESGEARRKAVVSGNVWEDALKAVTWIRMDTNQSRGSRQ